MGEAKSPHVASDYVSGIFLMASLLSVHKMRNVQFSNQETEQFLSGGV